MSENGYVEEYRITGYRDYIERLAFGYNDDNTCSAISAAMALNYLSLRCKRQFLPAEWMASRRHGITPASSDDVKTAYPETYALHRYLVEQCDLTAVSYGDRITVPFRQFVREKSPDKGIDLSWTLFPRASTIISNLKNDLPVLITTTIAGEHSFHTMLCYGYRRSAKGGMELLVHNGWYGEEHTLRDTADGTPYQKETRLKKRRATYGYYFTIR